MNLDKCLHNTALSAQLPCPAGHFHSEVMDSKQSKYISLTVYLRNPSLHHPSLSQHINLQNNKENAGKHQTLH